ncbi:hypothetical protein GH769_00205 [Pseudomonas sp. CFSAN084952]|uniref:hypothetical protein n=1 Tax=Pseudomonas TaxID=286 RepID=UPI001299B85C|nr:hypothetical protein [Pseudomonas sp. CFSAN084952]QGF91717.1 hypothetical protein GH769_00205 [Pseudomonas sp. CFSAN084952]
MQKLTGRGAMRSSGAPSLRNTLTSANQATQQTFNEVEAQVTQLVLTATGQISAVELDAIVKAAQAQGQSSVSRFTDNTNRLIAEASAFAEAEPIFIPIERGGIIV